jgi:membrane dipeptidase
MGIKTKYKGYQAYQYLEAGYDYRSFNLTKGVSRVPEYLIPLLEEEETRVKKIANEVVFISLHDHPVLFPEDMREVFAYAREGRQHTAYAALAASYYDCVFDNMMDGTGAITSKGGWKWDETLHDFGIRLADLAHQDFVIKVESVNDILRAHSEGRIGIVFGIEGAAPIENELDRIDILYGFGLRLMGITYSESNALGSGLKESADGGLTAFGQKAVERMNKLGMAIDVSHVGPRTALDVVAASSKPVFISHVGARALWQSKRLAADELLTACAEKGGVIGVEAAPHTTLTEKHRKHSIDSFMEHFKYIVELVGIDHVAFGPDTLYGDHVGLHHALLGQLSIKDILGTQSFEEVPYVRGLENPTETSKNIIRWLVKTGYSDEYIVKILGGNILRLLRTVWD